MQTSLPFRPPRGRQSSTSFLSPHQVFQNHITPPRSQLRQRHLSFRLPSLRERSHESTSEAPLKTLGSDFNEWTGTWQEYLAAKDAGVVAKEIAIDPHIVQLQKKCAERLEEKGGDLSLDIFKNHERDASKDHMRHVSSTSSAYGEVGSVSPPHTPDSPPHYGTMNLKDVEKYSRVNDRLSNLRSDSSSQGSGGNSVKGAVEDAAEVAQGWEAILSARPKKNPFINGKGVKPDFPREWREGRFHSNPPLVEFSRLYDGTYSPEKHTAQNSTDATSSDTTAPTNFTAPSNKRKASVFSLRSIQTSIAAKRQKLNIRSLANSVTTHLTEAKRRLKQHGTTNRRSFEA